LTFRDALQGRAAAIGVTVEDADIAKLQRYYELLARWNRTINLTGLPLEGFPDTTIDRLIIEPLLAAEFLNSTVFDWADLGSGGGSPAIPLKIVRPTPRLSLIESKDRKSAFLREAVRSLNLTDVSVLVDRLESMPATLRHSFDLVTVRAVRLDLSVAEAVRNLLKPAGRLFVFGRTRQDLAGLQPTESVPMPSGHSHLYIYRLDG
jgi:16S rRNA (guanine527-N7)-methyltransferase